MALRSSCSLPQRLQLSSFVAGVALLFKAARLLRQANTVMSATFSVKATPKNMRRRSLNCSERHSNSLDSAVPIRTTNVNISRKCDEAHERVRSVLLPNASPYDDVSSIHRVDQ